MEAKDILGFLGIDAEKVKTVDDLKPEFEKEFVRIKTLTVDSEAIKPIVGKILNEVNTNIKAAVKPFDAGIDFESDEWKNAPTKNKVQTVFDKIAAKQKSIVDDLTVKATQGNDQKVKDLEEAVRKANEKFEDLQNRHTVTVKDFNEFKTTTETTAKNNTLNSLLKQEKEKVPLIDGVTKVHLLGFDQALKDKFNFELDDAGQTIIPKLKSTGKPVPSTKVTGENKTLAEILEDEAIELGIFKANSQGGNEKPKPKQAAAASSAAGEEGKTVGRVIPKRFGR